MIGQLFRHAGSKGRLAQDIVNMMPSHDKYIEPFGGTLSVFLCKNPSAFEVVNDIDDEIVNFYRVLRDDADELVRRVSLTPWSRSEFMDCMLYRDAGLETDPIERAREFWFLKDHSINGMTSTFNQICGVRSTAISHIDRMMDVATRLRSVLVECVDYRELFARFDDRDALFYCDPPYLGETRSGSIYEHEMLGAHEHDEFARVCNDSKASVMVSGYPSAAYESMFPAPRWNRTDFETTSSSDPHAETNKRVIECVWCNFPVSQSQKLW